MNLRQVECFIAVADHLSFTRAAEELGISQPPLSQHIKRLEADLGASLFTRTKHHVELTNLGRAFLPRAKSLVHKAQVTRLEILEMTGLEGDELRIGASGTLAAFLLPEIVAEFRAGFPSIGIHLVQRRSEDILAMVEDGKLDVGLVRLPSRGTTKLEYTRIGTEPLFAALPPSHKHAGETRISLSALKNEEFIMCSDGSEPFYTLVSELCIGAGFVPNIICAGAEYTTVFRLVGMGVGVSVTSRLATRLVVEPSPVFVQIDEVEAMIHTTMVTQPSGVRSPAAGAFRAAVLRSLQMVERS